MLLPSQKMHLHIFDMYYVPRAFEKCIPVAKHIGTIYCGASHLVQLLQETPWEEQSLSLQQWLLPASHGACFSVKEQKLCNAYCGTVAIAC